MLKNEPITLKKIHDNVRLKIENQTKKYKEQADKHIRFKACKEGDLVWIHLRKEHFPNRRFAKL